METNQSPSKKRGPVPKGYVDTHVLAEPELIEWAKAQREGLSGLFRLLLRQERSRRELTISKA
jgi:hypothetical protein